MFYEFNQNNSGGVFKVDAKVCHRLFIEADSADEAVTKAEELGCYWYGVDTGVDCPCCGDRWSKDYLDSRSFPMEYRLTESSAERWKEKYGSYEIMEEPVEKKIELKFTRSSWTEYEGKVRFNSVEEYAQYLANEYGWTAPDARIYYKDGTVKEIFVEKKGR